MVFITVFVSNILIISTINKKFMNKQEQFELYSYFFLKNLEVQYL